MDGRYRNNLYLNDQEDPEYSPENSEESPRATTVNNSPKRRRAAQKRVVSVPIKDVEGSRLKGETPPPSDSWAWRKYGQKPIKGSPYPRGYYRCSSSKGCPARKQVERSRADPTMLVVTYSCEHNHPWPASKNNNNNNNTSNKSKNNITEKVTNDNTVSTIATEVNSGSSNSAISGSDDDVAAFENQFANITGDFPLYTYEFKWFTDLDSTQSTSIRESTIIDSGDGSVAMGEEDESLFADLGELPECSLVFRRGVFEDRSSNLGHWCETTG